MCIPDGILRAKLDGELNETESAAVSAHLAECGRCRERSAELAARAERVGALFSELTPQPGETDATSAFARLGRSAPVRHARRFVWPARLTPAWGAAAAAVVVALFVATAPGRAVAQKLLGMLRIKTIVAVPMTRNFMIEGKGDMLQQLLADSVVRTKESRRVVVATRDEAAGMTGLNVRLPDLRSDTPQLSVNTESAFHFNVDRKRLDTLLSVTGRSDIEVPPTLNGAEVLVSVPASVQARYGECPSGEGWQTGDPSRFLGCVMVTEVPVPTVVTTPELDLRQVAEFGLQLTGMTASQAHLFSETVDWTSTLAIPVPPGAASYDSVAVDGVKGLLIAGLRAAVGKEWRDVLRDRFRRLGDGFALGRVVALTSAHARRRHRDRKLAQGFRREGGGARPHTDGGPR
jgi:hypothetical protein